MDREINLFYRMNNGEKMIKAIIVPIYDICRNDGGNK